MQLSTESVTKSFAGVHALSEVSVEVDKGQVVGVIGPNGSGKTTLVNVISGVVPPTSGSICLGEDRWHRRSSHAVARCGVARTFQTIRLFEEMTVLENVEVAAASSPRSRGFRRTRVASREALAMLGLADRAGEMAKNLSYGLQRRVELARAVAGRPDFLLLDEPAAGLNEAESDELLGTLLRLRDAVECGVLMIDHDLRLIMRGTERIFVLNEGRLLADGGPEQIRNDPRVVASYLGTDAKSAAAEMEADPHAGDPSQAGQGSEGGEA
ncbi:MAG TPA: ABC transporter ATP-binding protein [Solirubrobacterales bacterium]